MKIISTILMVSALSLLTACGTSGDLGRGKTGKSITLQGGTYDQIWEASLAALKQTDGDQSLEIEKNLNITKEDKAAGVIHASTGMSLLSWGEVVGVYISPAGEAPQHTIEVESITKLKTALFANNWEDELLAAIQKKLTTPQ